MALRRAGCLIVCVLLWCEPAGSGQPQRTVRTASGPIAGRVEQGLAVFRGVPFAAPPVGELRWRPPAEPEPWTRTLGCTRFKPACPQKPGGFGGTRGPFSEDCLYLNVWAPAAKPDRPLPVMVWIHGGGFQRGTASIATYDGAAMAREGVVLVSVNYRLGPLGFLAHPALTAESPNKTSGNYGLLDQLAALRWVRRNIAAFGGNASNVTIFGQSAGGVSVCALLASPRAKGLFHRAICHSGGAPRRLRYRDRPNGRLSSAEDAGVGFARRLIGRAGADGSDVLKLLRSRPADEVLQAADNVPLGPGGGIQGFLSVDGWLLTQSPGEAFAAGKQTPVPLMVGTTADEGTIFTQAGRIDSPAKLRVLLRVLFRGRAGQAGKLYPADDRAATRKAVAALYSDVFVCGARLVARAHAAAQKDTYLYHFTRTPDYGLRERLGCFHGIELPYLFGTFAKSWKPSADDRELGRTMRRCWVRFAKTGNPNGSGPPAWPRYTAAADRHLVFDTPIRAGEHLRKKRCDFLDETPIR